MIIDLKAKQFFIKDNNETDWLEQLEKLYKLNPFIEELHFDSLSEKQQNQLFKFLQERHLSLTVTIKDEPILRFDNLRQQIYFENENKKINLPIFNEFGAFATKPVLSSNTFLVSNQVNEKAELPNKLKNQKRPFTGAAAVKVKVREVGKEKQQQQQFEQQQQQENEKQKEKQKIQLRLKNLQKEIVPKNKPLKVEPIELKEDDYLTREKLSDMVEYYKKAYPEQQNDTITNALEKLWDNVVGKHPLLHKGIRTGRVLTHIHKDLFKLLIDNKDKLSDGFNLENLPPSIKCVPAEIGSVPAFVLVQNEQMLREKTEDPIVTQPDLFTLVLIPQKSMVHIADFNQFLKQGDNKLIADENETYQLTKKNPDLNNLTALFKHFEQHDLVAQGASDQLKQIFDNLKFNENDIKAYFLVIENEGPNKAMQLLKGLAQLRIASESAYEKFKLNFIDGNNNLTRLVNEDGLLALKQIIELNEQVLTGNIQAQAPLEWWNALSSQHTEHDKTSNLGRMWKAYQQFLENLDSKKLTLPEKFTALPIKNLFVALDRIQYLIGKCERDPQGQLDNIFELDLGVDGAMYAAQAEDANFAMRAMSYLSDDLQKNRKVKVERSKFYQRICVFDQYGLKKIYNVTINPRTGKPIKPTGLNSNSYQGDRIIDCSLIKNNNVKLKIMFNLEQKKVRNLHSQIIENLTDVEITIDEKKQRAQVKVGDKHYDIEFALYAYKHGQSNDLSDSALIEDEKSRYLSIDIPSKDGTTITPYVFLIERFEDVNAIFDHQNKLKPIKLIETQICKFGEMRPIKLATSANKIVSNVDYFKKLEQEHPGQVFIPDQEFKKILFESIDTNNFDIIQTIASRYISQQSHHDFLEQYEAVFARLEQEVMVSPDAIQSLLVMTALLTTSELHLKNDYHTSPSETLEAILALFKDNYKKIEIFTEIFNGLINDVHFLEKGLLLSDVYHLVKLTDNINDILEIIKYSSNNTPELSRAQFDIFTLLANQVHFPKRPLAKKFSTYLKEMENVDLLDDNERTNFQLFCMLNHSLSYKDFKIKIESIISDQSNREQLVNVLKNIDYSDVEAQYVINIKDIEKASQSISFKTQDLIFRTLKKEQAWLKQRTPNPRTTVALDVIINEIDKEVENIAEQIVSSNNDNYFELTNKKIISELQDIALKHNINEQNKIGLEKTLNNILLTLQSVKFVHSMNKSLKTKKLSIVEQLAAAAEKKAMLAAGNEKIAIFFKNMNQLLDDLQNRLLQDSIKDIRHINHDSDYVHNFKSMMSNEMPTIDVSALYKANNLFQRTLRFITGSKNPLEKFNSDVMTHFRLTKIIGDISNNPAQRFNMKAIMEGFTLALNKKMPVKDLYVIASTLKDANVPMGDFLNNYINKGYAKRWGRLQPNEWCHGVNAINSFHINDTNIAQCLHDILLKTPNGQINSLVLDIKKIAQVRNKLTSLNDSALKQDLLKRFDQIILSVDIKAKKPNLTKLLTRFTVFEEIVPMANDPETANGLALLLKKISLNQVSDLMKVTASKKFIALDESLRIQILNIARQSCLTQWRLDEHNHIKKTSRDKVNDFKKTIDLLLTYYNDKDINAKINELNSFGSMAPASALTKCLLVKEDTKQQILAVLNQHDLNPSHNAREVRDAEKENAEFKKYLNQVENLLTPGQDKKLETQQVDELAKRFKVVNAMGSQLNIPDPLNPSQLIKLPEFSQKSLQAYYLQLSEALQSELSKKNPSSETILNLELSVMSVSREILFRTPPYHYPFSIQMLPLLMTGITGDSTIFQVATGEGKSLLTAMYAMLYHARGFDVKIASWNSFQAQADQLKFERTFDFINASTALIDDNAKTENYKLGGINYGSMEAMVQLGNVAKTEGGELRRDEEGRKVPTVILADEIDFYATQHVSPINLSQPNPLFIDAKGNNTCEWIYKLIIEQYQNIINMHTSEQFPLEEDLFQARASALKDKIFELVKLDPMKRSFIKKISNVQWQIWMQAAIDSEQYLSIGQGNETPDYRVVDHKNGAGQVTHRTVNVIANGITQDTSTQFKMGIHQMLTAREQLRDKDNSKPPFIMPVEMLSIAGTNVKNAMLSFLSKGLMIGLTGTPGDVDTLCDELKMKAIKVPTRQKIQRQVEAVTYTEGNEKYKKIEEWIKESFTASRGDQPILLVCENDNALREWECLFTNKLREGQVLDFPNMPTSLAKYLKKNGYTVQFLDANDDEQTMENKVKLAGNPKVITIATSIGGRGVDFSTKHAEGFLGIPTDPFTHTNWEQVVGRVGRQGSKGTIKALLDTNELKQYVERSNEGQKLEVNEDVLTAYKNEFNTIDKIPARYKSENKNKTESEVIESYQKTLTIDVVPKSFVFVYYYRKNFNDSLVQQKEQMDLISKYRKLAQKPYIRLLKSIFRESIDVLSEQHKIEITDKIIKKLTEFHQAYDLTIHRKKITELPLNEQQEELAKFNQNLENEFKSWYQNFKEEEILLKNRDEQEGQYTKEKTEKDKKITVKIADHSMANFDENQKIMNSLVESRDLKNEEIKYVYYYLQAYLTRHLFDDNADFLNFAIETTEKIREFKFVNLIEKQDKKDDKNNYAEEVLFILACNFTDYNYQLFKPIYDKLLRHKDNPDLFSVIARRELNDYPNILDKVVLDKLNDVNQSKETILARVENKLYQRLKSLQKLVGKDAKAIPTPTEEILFSILSNRKLFKENILGKQDDSYLMTMLIAVNNQLQKLANENPDKQIEINKVMTWINSQMDSLAKIYKSEATTASNKEFDTHQILALNGRLDNINQSIKNTREKIKKIRQGQQLTTESNSEIISEKNNTQTISTQEQRMLGNLNILMKQRQNIEQVLNQKHLPVENSVVFAPNFESKTEVEPSQISTNVSVNTDTSLRSIDYKENEKEEINENNDKDIRSGQLNAFGYYERTKPGSNDKLPTAQEDAVVFHTIDVANAKPSPIEIGQRLWTTHFKLNEAYAHKNEKDGTTAATTVYDGEGNFITATLGDSVTFAAVYDEHNKLLGVIRLNTVLHHPETDKERIHETGGVIDSQNNRVGGLLAVSRSIGDNTIKGVNAESKIDINNIDSIAQSLSIEKKNVNHIKIITTCDGFTEGSHNKDDAIMQEAYLFNALQEVSDPKKLRESELAGQLVKRAAEDGSKDDISVAVYSINLTESRSNKNQMMLMGVYDGHGGAAASQYVAEEIGKEFTQQCNLSQDQYEKQTHSAVQARNQHISDRDDINSLKNSLADWKKEFNKYAFHEDEKWVYATMLNLDDILNDPILDNQEKRSEYNKILHTLEDEIKKTIGFSINELLVSTRALSSLSYDINRIKSELESLSDQQAQIFSKQINEIFDDNNKLLSAKIAAVKNILSPEHLLPFYQVAINEAENNLSVASKGKLKEIKKLVEFIDIRSMIKANSKAFEADKKDWSVQKAAYLNLMIKYLINWLNFYLNKFNKNSPLFAKLTDMAIKLQDAKTSDKAKFAALFDDLRKLNIYEKQPINNFLSQFQKMMDNLKKPHNVDVSLDPENVIIKVNPTLNKELQNALDIQDIKKWIEACKEVSRVWLLSDAIRGIDKLIKQFEKSEPSKDAIVKLMANIDTQLDGAKNRMSLNRRREAEETLSVIEKIRNNSKSREIDEKAILTIPNANESKAHLQSAIHAENVILKLLNKFTDKIVEEDASLKAIKDLICKRCTSLDSKENKDFNSFGTMWDKLKTINLNDTEHAKFFKENIINKIDLNKKDFFKLDLSSELESSIKNYNNNKSLTIGNKNL